jgi:hypothetical protein
MLDCAGFRACDQPCDRNAVENGTSESRVLKRKIGLYAGGLAFALAASAPGLAQPVPPPYPGPVPPGYEAGLPPQEVNAIVRSTGLRPLGPPMRHGPAYVVRAIDPDGEEVRVVINARMGRITKVIPVTLPRYALVPPSGRPPGRIAVVPDGYGPDGLEARPPIGPGGPPTGSVPAMTRRRIRLRRQRRRCRGPGPRLPPLSRRQQAAARTTTAQREPRRNHHPPNLTSEVGPRTG